MTVGHNAILHGSRIGPRTLIGMGAILLTGSVIGEECVIGAGALITEGMVVPPRSLVLGMPGRVVRPVTDMEIEAHLQAAEDYYQKALAHVAGKYQP